MIDDADQVQGILTGIIQYQLTSTFKNLTARCVIIGGPLVEKDDPELTTKIINDFDSIVKKKVIYTQIRNLYNLDEEKKVLTDLKYRYEDHLNILVDLTFSDEKIWNEIHRKKRNEIRRAEKESLSFRPILSLDDLQKSYKLLESIYRRIKLPIFPFAVFQNAFELLSPKGHAVFFGAYLEEKLIGTMYTFCYKGRIYDFFAGSDDENKYKYANSLIPWKVFLWGKENSMNLFDWGGAGKPGVHYGVRDYKKRFGGETVNFGRFIKVYNPVLFLFAKLALRLKQNF